MLDIGAGKADVLQHPVVKMRELRAVAAAPAPFAQGRQSMLKAVAPPARGPAGMQQRHGCHVRSPKMSRWAETLADGLMSTNLVIQEVLYKRDLFIND